MLTSAPPTRCPLRSLTRARRLVDGLRWGHLRCRPREPLNVIARQFRVEPLLRPEHARSDLQDVSVSLEDLYITAHGEAFVEWRRWAAVLGGGHPRLRDAAPQRPMAHTSHSAGWNGRTMFAHIGADPATVTKIRATTHHRATHRSARSVAYERRLAGAASDAAEADTPTVSGKCRSMALRVEPLHRQDDYVA
jgi:hypothetical protein